jgi:hypothetical protein
MLRRLPSDLGKFPESLAKRYTEAADEFSFTDEEWKLVKGSSDLWVASRTVLPTFADQKVAYPP